MNIICRATQDFRSGPEPVFELMVDAAGFPACFTGFGLIPAIRRIHLVEPLAAGVIRHIYNADNSVLVEKVTLLDRPHRHCYSLSGFKAPFSWLVKHGESDWQLSKLETGSKVCWTYKFMLTSVLMYPLCFIVLKIFMQGAMQRCLQNMKALCDPDLKID